MVANMERRPNRSSHDEGALEKLRDQATQMSARVRDGARALTEQAAEKIGQVSDAVWEEAEKALNGQKDRAASQVRKAGSAIHRAASLLHAGKVDKVADYVDRAAEGAEQASQYIEERSLAEMADDLADVARRHPLATFGTLFLAGVAVARFVRAGLDESSSAESE